MYIPLRSGFYWQKKSPRWWIEPRSPAWQAGILTIILTRNSWSKSGGQFIGRYRSVYQTLQKNDHLQLHNIKISPSGNWTPVSRVTGVDTHHYTNEDLRTSRSWWCKPSSEFRWYNDPCESTLQWFLSACSTLCKINNTNTLHIWQWRERRLLNCLQSVVSFMQDQKSPDHSSRSW